MADWAGDYFERGYSRRWGLPAPTEQVRLHADGLWKLLQLAHGSRVIDIGCGHGRHALALAERGVEVLGLDSSTALLNRARQLSVELRTPAHWIRADMRRLPIRSSVASAAMLMDAFGFFETDREHDAVLAEAARVLEPHGRLVLKVVNGAAVLADFRPTAREERDGVEITIHRTLALAPPRMTERITIEGDEKYERRQRLYRIDELSTAMEKAGFDVVGVYASPDGAEFDPAVSSTMWLVASLPRL